MLAVLMVAYTGYGATADLNDNSELTFTIDDDVGYDVIQVNLDPMDLQMLPKLKELTKNSSTIIVGNHDHSPELWAKSMEHPHIWKQTVDNCDAIFATTPTAHNLMNNILDTKVNLIPHPCETHVMKRIGTVKKFDHIAVVHHRYDNNVLMPFLHLEK